MIFTPIWDYHCKDCGMTFESIEVWESHRATKCKHCDSPNIERIVGAHLVRMDPDTVRHEVPDPVPPLEELRGKAVKGSETGLKDKPYAEKDITKSWEYRKDKYGNRQWYEKRRIHVDMGKNK